MLRGFSFVDDAVLTRGACASALRRDPVRQEAEVFGGNLLADDAERDFVSYVEHKGQHEG